MGSGGGTECEAAAAAGYQTSARVIGAAVARNSTYSAGPS
jgi:hypothetical protein